MLINDMRRGLFAALINSANITLCKEIYMINEVINNKYKTMPWDLIDNVVFDVGDVLVNLDAEATLAHYYPGDTALIARTITKATSSPFWHIFDYGIISEKECAEAMAGDETDLIEPIYHLMHDWPDFRYVVKEGADAVHICKAHGKKLYVLSNYPERHFRRNLVEYDFFSLFDGYVVSAVEHQLKPDKDIYYTLSSRYQLNPERTLFIDDSTANIAAALLLGWQGLCFRVPGQLYDFFKE